MSKELLFMAPEEQEIKRLEKLVDSLFCNCLLATEDCRKCRIKDRIKKLKSLLPVKGDSDL